VGKVKIVRFILILSAVCLAAAACTAIPPRQPVEMSAQVKTFAVLPPEIPLTNGTANGSGTSHAQLEAGASVLESQLADYFKNRPEVRIVNREQLEGVAAATTGSRMMLAHEIGKKLQVDAVLLSSIYRYRRRDGSEYSVNQSASVAFELQLVAVASGQVLCALVFDESQEPLFENIFSFSKAASRGFRWVTAEQLTAEGVKKKLNSCVYLHPQPPPAETP
jgi:hypothetical protein